MRTVNRLIAAILALGLIAAGFISVLEIILVALGLPPLVVPYESWLDTARSSTFGDRSVIVAAIALLALGLVVTVLQLLRRSPLSYSLVTKHDRVEAQIDRRSLERLAARAARDVDGVQKVRCRAKAGGLAVSATTGREEVLGLDGMVRAAVEDRLLALEPARALTVTVKLQSPSGR
jgi:hypothetical protein